MQKILSNDSNDKFNETPTAFNLKNVHSSWLPGIKDGLSKLDPVYLQQLYASLHWLPGPEKIFNAFSLPLDKIQYVLLGESPYPRAQSANGYAFWDAAVTDIWSPTGLSKAVNRATSLRNIIKMLLVADGLLPAGKITQDDIARLDKTPFVKTNAEFFHNFLKHGILLLNATLVLQQVETAHVHKDAKAWRPFLKHMMDYLLARQPNVQFILLGNIANEIDNLLTQPGLRKFYAEHPYNVSFISNPDVITFFKPLHLLYLA